MDSKEARFAFGFLLLGLAPLFATAGGAGLGVVFFIIGMLIAISPHSPEQQKRGSGIPVLRSLFSPRRCP